MEKFYIVCKRCGCKAKIIYICGSYYLKCERCNIEERVSELSN